MEFGLTFFSLLLTFGVFFISLSFHEFAHAYMSYRLGDPTAKFDGRLTLNPLAHIDPIGTVIFPIFMALSGLPAFGWAKPVYVNINNFRHPARDNFLTAITGPIANIIIIIVSAMLLKVFPDSLILILFIEINTILAIFNLLPIPPLDGSKIWHLFLSDESYYNLEKIGPVILIGLLLLSSRFNNFVFHLIQLATNAVLNLV